MTEKEPIWKDAKIEQKAMKRVAIRRAVVKLDKWLLDSYGDFIEMYGWILPEGTTIDMHVNTPGNEPVVIRLKAEMEEE